MSKLKGLLLTQGMHGMISQVEGLAKALDIDFTHHKVELKSIWKLVPPKFTPISQSVYKKIEDNDFDLIISCGRKSVIPSIHLKSISKKKIFNIHIQDPKIDFNHFDFIVAPEHDGINGENVISTKGAIHYLSEKEIEENTAPVAKVTAPAPVKAIATQPKKGTSIAARTDRYTIQITSKRMLKDAQLFNQKMIGKGFDAYIQKVVFNTDEIWYRVRVGSYDNYNSAKKAADALSGELGMTTWVDFVRKEQ